MLLGIGWFDLLVHVNAYAWLSCPARRIFPLRAMCITHKQTDHFVHARLFLLCVLKVPTYAPARRNATGEKGHRGVLLLLPLSQAGQPPGLSCVTDTLQSSLSFCGVAWLAVVFPRLR